MTRMLKTGFIAGLLALTLAACGVKGPLDPKPSSLNEMPADAPASPT